jgi:hypothetical protein
VGRGRQLRRPYSVPVSLAAIDASTSRDKAARCSTNRVNRARFSGSVARSRLGALLCPSLRRLQPRRTGPRVKTRRYIGLTRSLEKSFALWTRRQRSGLLADLFGPGCQPVSKGQNLLEAASTLHDTTSFSSRVLTVGFESTDPNMPCSGGRSPSRHKVAGASRFF